MPITSEQIFEDLFVKELELLCKLEGSPYFTFHDPLNHGTLCASHNILTGTVDIYDSWDMYNENLFKPIINTRI